MSDNPHYGTSLDKLLEEEGILDELESVAAKRVFVYQLEKELKKQNIKTQVVVLSNLGQQEDMTKAAALGAKTYFVKSNTPIADIVDYVKKTLETNQ